MKSSGPTIAVLIAPITTVPGNQRVELYHQVQRPRRTAEARPTIEAVELIKAGAGTNDSQVSGEHAVGKREEGVDRIRGWPSIALGELEVERRRDSIIAGALQQAAEVPEQRCALRCLPCPAVRRDLQRPELLPRNA